MQRLPRKEAGRFDPGVRYCLGRQLALAPVNRISDQAVAAMGQVDPDLVGAPGLKPAFEQRCRGGYPEPLNDARPRHRMTPAMPKDRLPLPISLVAGQLGLDLEDVARLETRPLDAMQAGIVRIGHPVADGQIVPFDRVGRELIGQTVVGPVRFGRDQKAARFLINAVDDARTLFAANA